MTAPAPSPAQQADDWNRRMAPMADVVFTDVIGRERPAVLAGQAFVIGGAAVVSARIFVTPDLTAQLPLPLDCVRPMTDADRLRFASVAGSA